LAEVTKTLKKFRDKTLSKITY